MDTTKDSAELRAAVRASISRYLDQAVECADQEDLVEAGLPLDSMGTMGLVVELEREFRTRIDEEALLDLDVRSIATITAVLVRSPALGPDHEGNTLR